MDPSAGRAIAPGVLPAPQETGVARQPLQPIWFPILLRRRRTRLL